MAPPSLVGYLTAGATPTWLLGSFAVLSVLYRTDISANPATTATEISAEQRPASAEFQEPGAEVLTKRAQAERAYVHLSATGGPVSAGQLAAAAGLSASYARALVAALEHAWAAIRSHHPEVPQVVIVVASGSDPGSGG